MLSSRRRFVIRKSQFETLELYKLFRKYTDKINFGYFSLYLILTFFLFMTHIVVLIVQNFNNRDHLLTLMPDLIVYIVITLLSVIGLFFLEIVVKKQKKWYYFCVLGFVILFCANFILPLYHSLHGVSDGYYYTPAYSFLLIIACFVFFGVPKNWQAASLGFMVSVTHMTVVIFITYNNIEKQLEIERIFSDIIFLVCFNGLGLYFRYLNEIVQRKSFLDRRDCIVNTFQLKHEKEQEEQLMSSIIPVSMISKVKENYVKGHSQYKKSKMLIEDNLFQQQLLEEHEGVTILFADIVNYTVMTKKLNINALLETLNELFGRFDDASDKLKVIRIKFLGDCYYCVSGLPPNPPENPAEACVDLGLKMINIIAKVRQERDLTIDMRIGIHTGRIICGIIGKIKYQFDIWSKDVDIANKMESEGVAGKVHITNQTRELLEKPYIISNTNKGSVVPQFKQYNLQTFLVSPMPEHPGGGSRSSSITENDESLPSPLPRASIFRKHGMSPIGNSLQASELPHITEEIPTPLTLIESNNLDKDHERKTMSNGDANGRRNTIYQRRASKFRVTEDRRSTADIKRRTAFMNSNFKRYIERTATVDQEMEKTINNMSFSKKDQYIKEKEINSLLIFRNKKNELDYVKMTDPMFKYYILGQVVLLFCMYLIENLTLTRNTWWRPEFVTSQAVLIFILLPCTWTYFLYLRYKTKFGKNTPQNFLIKFLYKTSKFITQNFWARLFIYTVVYILFITCVLMEVLFCYKENEELDQSSVGGYCLVPWSMTQACSVTLIMTFLFLKIFIWIKLLYALITTLLYGCCIVLFVNNIYKNSETFNPYLPPQTAHILSVAFLTFTLHLIDRQTDYMNRLDFLWTAKLLEEKRKANEQQAVNTNMLLNILPKHVAKIYLDVNKASNDLYYESHNNVAVMFASMIFDECYMDDENSFLIMMNNYVTIIDTLINRKEFSKVEKIKIAKWTYMAACGLTIPSENDNSGYGMETHPTVSSLDTLLNFASKMFVRFREQNNSFTEVHLRIGICCGPIVAGVVGSKKPLYDIWGDAVNMASRMDSTGVPGRIQVLESTAQEIEKLGYECEERGIRTVKGVGEVKTYFVKLNDMYGLVRRSFEE